MLLVERLVAVVMLLLGLSFVLQARRWVRAGRQVQASPDGFLPYALLLLVAGLAIVLTHNRWVVDWPLAVTLFGWILVVKATAFLFLPGWIARADGWPERTHLATTRIGGAITAALGAILIAQSW